MERSESVNSAETVDQAPDFDDELVISDPVHMPSGDQGPCLYLGSAGQRCNRGATAGGFCARHQSGSSQILSLPQISRRTAAIIGLLAVLWPVLADVVRELFRLLH